MQQRFHVSYHSDFDAALAAKKEETTKTPKINYQIRKRAKNFELVMRVPHSQAELILDQAYTKKKKKPKKQWKKVSLSNPLPE